MASPKYISDVNDTMEDFQAEPAKAVKSEATVASEVSGPSELQADTDAIDDTLDEEARLNLLATARDQDDLERDIGRQADKLLMEQADERDGKRLEKTSGHRDRLMGQLKKSEERLSLPGGSATKNLIRNEITNLKAQIANLDTELEQITARIEERHRGAEGASAEVTGGRLPNESRRDFLIRTGKITPFSKMSTPSKVSADLAEIMREAEDEEGFEAGQEDEIQKDSGPVSHRHLLAPGFDDAEPNDAMLATESPRSVKRRRIDRMRSVITSADDHSGIEEQSNGSEAEYAPDDASSEASAHSVVEESDYADSDDMRTTIPVSKSSKGKKRKSSGDLEEEDLTGIDDGDEKVYRSRLERWSQKRRAAREKAQQGEDRMIEQEEEPEWYQPHPTRSDAHLGEGLRIPGDIFPSLFDYQKTGVRWLWELHQQNVGGIVGDEMGLGKTIQIISFLAGLHYSKKLTKPIIVVAPATVMKQWVNEFHRWWPPLRVSILHTSGSGMMDLSRESRMEDDLEDETWNGYQPKRSKSHSAARKIVDRVSSEGHVLVTTYSGLQSYSDLLIPLEWQYAVLDEGHKIRNPNAAITIYCKELRTPNRVILSGTPMQNNLTELWSLFDFVYPMRLGTLVGFRQQFEFPIKQGGYANASNLQVETAMRCAETLKDAISPYLLQRFKVDVAADLPKKSERVLFCKLSQLQRRAYTTFLDSPEMAAILQGRRQALYGIDILRKICNHPDLVEHKTLSKRTGYDYGSPTKSGKMQVVKALLELWKRGGHKTLLFAQHRIMLDVLEKFVSSLGGFRYRRMDGNTSIKDRQNLVDEFNSDPNLHVFLLTTKVGGLGVNLTGADRVIIYDPDWNPSTDVQARERAWRLGQKKEVEIYRLMTAGTIEEKIYHRQIFKQFLSNKILRDPKQRQTFNLSDLHDLFTLSDNQNGTETGSLFKGTEIRFNKDKIRPDGREVKSTRDESSTLEISTTTDLNPISSIARQEDFKVEDEDQIGDAKGEGGEKKDRILSAIFSNPGIHSAHEHDAIISARTGKPKPRADPEIIAREAKRVAAKAALELQRAGEIARTVPAGVPTWTGVVGTAGRPEDRRTRGLASRGVAGAPSFLSGVVAAQQRSRGLPAPNSDLSPASGRSPAGSTTPSRSSTPQPRGKDFLVLIRDFLKVHNGMCYTQNLIDHFNRYCGTPQRTAEFKEMLKRIAVLEKGGRGRGKWILKKEFGGTA